MVTFTGTNLDDALDGYEVTPLEARREIEKHNLSFQDFITETELGKQRYYSSRSVLHWLGY